VNQMADRYRVKRALTSRLESAVLSCGQCDDFLPSFESGSWFPGCKAGIGTWRWTAIKFDPLALAAVSVPAPTAVAALHSFRTAPARFFAALNFGLRDRYPCNNEPDLLAGLQALFIY
jgi:hypothetical protein